MTLPTHLPDELARESEQRGLEVARYADTIPLKNRARAKPVLPNAPRLTRPKIDEPLDGSLSSPTKSATFLTPLSPAKPSIVITID